MGRPAVMRLCPGFVPMGVPILLGGERARLFRLSCWKQNLSSFPNLFPIHYLFDRLHSSCAEASPNTVTPCLYERKIERSPRIGRCFSLVSTGLCSIYQANSLPSICIGLLVEKFNNLERKYQQFVRRFMQKFFCMNLRTEELFKLRKRSKIRAIYHRW